jgi:hypothetical protein
VTVQQRPPTQPEFELQRPATSRRVLILAACALAGTAIGIGAQIVTDNTPASSTPVATSPKPTATVSTTVSSWDPAQGGSGFRKTSLGWQTQDYASATFGNLKPGIGLVLDLGAAHTVSAVTLDAGTGPLTVQLRTGDSPPTSVSGYKQVGAPTQASGPTTLAASGGGSHRYWMIWVTSLGPAGGGGYSAVIRNPTVRVSG